MKVLIVSTIVPFIEGGGTFIVDSLCKNLQKAGHTTEVLKLPFCPNYATMLEQMLALQMLDVADHGECMIALRTPSYLISHPNKVVWFLHHHRGAYDLWDTPFQDIPNTPEGLKIRECIIKNDQRALSEAKAVFSISKRVSQRLQTFNGLRSEVIYPPLLDEEPFHAGDCGDYVFFPSRITLGKRQRLAVESMRYVKSKVKLVIAGMPDIASELEHIKHMVAEHGLESKVKIMDRWISSAEKVEMLSQSLGVLFLPFDEDYGYVTLEAFRSEKPVITCTDSGGPLEFVDHTITGLVAAPEPQAIAEQLDALYDDKKRAVEMGKAGKEKCGVLNIGWEHTLERLLA